MPLSFFLMHRKTSGLELWESRLFKGLCRMLRGEKVRGPLWIILRSCFPFLTGWCWSSPTVHITMVMMLHLARLADRLLSSRLFRNLTALQCVLSTWCAKPRSVCCHLRSQSEDIVWYVTWSLLLMFLCDFMLTIKLYCIVSYHNISYCIISYCITLSFSLQKKLYPDFYRR